MTLAVNTAMKIQKNLRRLVGFEPSIEIEKIYPFIMATEPKEPTEKDYEQTKIALKGLFWFFSGAILSFMLQLMYDAFREEPFYQSIMSISYWRVFLALACFISFILMVRYMKKYGVQ